MDNHNYFESTTTYYLHRLEYLVLEIICLALLYIHWDEVRILPFILLFIYIDLIGYIPGAIAFRKSKNKKIPKIFYVLYNSMHSLVSGIAVAALWAIFVGPEWALLAIPIHQFGDRAIFGNFLKPFSVSFEPKTHPQFKTLLASLNPNKY